MRTGNLAQDAVDAHRVGAIGHADLQDKPPHRVATGIVCHCTADQIGVGHDHIGTVKGFDPRRAHRNVADIAVLATDLDPVAFGNRPFDQQDNPRDKVADDGLQAETNPHRQRTGDNRQRRQVDACRCDGDQCGQKDADIANTRNHRHLPAGVNLCLRQQRCFQCPLQGTRQEQSDRKHHDQRDERSGRQCGVADGNTGPRARPQLGQIGHPRAPDQRKQRRRGDQQQKSDKRGHQSDSAGR